MKAIYKIDRKNGEYLLYLSDGSAGPSSTSQVLVSKDQPMFDRLQDSASRQILEQDWVAQAVEI